MKVKKTEERGCLRPKTEEKNWCQMTKKEGTYSFIRTYTV